MRPLLTIMLLTVSWSVAHADQLANSPGERQALVQLDQAKYMDARRLAEESLKTRKTMIAQFVMGVVHAEFEGNLARGLFYIREAKKVLFSDHGSPPEGVHPQRWHKRILMREQHVLGMMDNRTGQLDVLDQHDELYRPKQRARRIWPLLKLGRFDEARKIGQALIHHERPEIRERAYNGLMAVEEEAGNRESSYEWGVRGLADTRGESCVIATNLALGARRTFRFSETVKHDQTALKARDRSCPTSPHAQLAAMYLVFGEFQKCLSSLKALRSAPREADMKVQNEMVIKARFVELLYALGAFEEAALRAEQIIEEPDRAGMVSASAETVELTNNLLAWTVFAGRIEMLDEMISARSFVGGLPLRIAQQRVAATRWRAKREAMRLAAMPGVLIKAVRPYYTDSMPWYGGNLGEILGHGVIAKAMEEAEAVEKDFPEKIELIFQAHRGETAWRDGELATAIAMGNRLLKDLPKETRLLRMRVRAWLADSYRRQGQLDDASVHYHQVLDFYPTVLRHLKIPVPITFLASGDRAEELQDRLSDSPRLVETENAGFNVRIEDDGVRLRVCLEGQKLYGCNRRRPPESETESDPLAGTVDRFHDQVFSPRIELTQSDINSLDGRAVRGDAKGAIDALLGREKRGKRKAR